MTDLTRVLIVDDHAMIAQMFRRLLDKEADIEVVAAVGTGEEARREVRRGPIDVVVLDFDLPDTNGADLAREVHAVLPDAGILMVTASTDERTLTRSLEAGCAGFITKGRDFEELLTAVRTVARGESVVDPSVLRTLLPKLQRSPDATRVTLSNREREVLDLMAEGKSSRAISETLVISHHTARNHVRHVLAKLGAHTQLEAVAIAARLGLLDR